MPALRTTADLLEDALRKSGEKTDGTSDYLASGLQYMNALYQAILAGGNEFDVDLGDPWPWAKAKYPGILTIGLPYNTGTVSLTQGSTSGSFSAAPVTSQVGNYLQIQNGVFEFYRITAHIAGATALTLDGPFNYPTALGTAAPFNSIQLDYDLNPGLKIIRQIGPMKVYQTQTTDSDNEGKITGMNLREFEKKWPLYRITYGIPTEYAVLAVTDGIPTVRFNKFIANIPNGLGYPARVEYDFIPQQTDLTNDSSSIPVIPDEFKSCLSLGVAYYICLDKEDAKAATFEKLTREKLRAMSNASRREFMQISKNRGRYLARGDDFGVRVWPTSEQ